MFQNKRSLPLLAPVSGLVVPLEQVPDPVFSQKVTGNGIAIDPTSHTLVAPCAGQITYIHPTARHALTLRSEQGPLILLHIGLDTVQLKGEGFQLRVAPGDKVQAGQSLIEFDPDVVAVKAKSLLTIMVITEPMDLAMQISPLTMARAGQDTLISVDASLIDNHEAGASSQVALKSDAILVQEKTGLHARPAAQLAQLAKTFKSDLHLQKNSNTANLKSLVSILSLEVAHQDQVFVLASGPDAQEAVRSVSQFIREIGKSSSAALTQSATHKSNPKSPQQTSSDNALRGSGISPGLAVGQIFQLKTTELKTTELSSTTPQAENAALDKALKIARMELESLRKGGSDATSIFAAHQELLEDPEILDAVHALIRTQKTAAFSWQQVTRQQSSRLAQLDNEVLSQRAIDLRDVGQRVLRLLVASAGPSKTGGANESEARNLAPYEQTILLAENLTPSETMQLDRTRVVGFCTSTGGATSHVAILAKSLGIPALAGLDLSRLTIQDGAEAILDGDRGLLNLAPNPTEIRTIREEQARQLALRNAAQALAHRPAITRDGQHIEVLANIGSAADARSAIQAGAEGVGLLRTEFLFLERDTAPSEDEQHHVYQEIADILGERPLTIRTLDVGGDKPLAYMPLPVEDNPFLGIRGIRVGLRNEALLREQLRAILRIKTAGPLHVMFPMIASLAEFRQAKQILEEERAKLGVPAPQIGVMIEVPSAALTADELAREVDFFSVGTNDLTQYTLAMDRGNPMLAAALEGIHPSVLKLVEMTVTAAHAHGKWVGVCGGWASDKEAIPLLLAMGVDELSSNIYNVPQVKSQIRELSLNEIRQSHGPQVKSPFPNPSQGIRYESQNAVFVSPENR